MPSFKVKTCLKLSLFHSFISINQVIIQSMWYVACINGLYSFVSCKCNVFLQLVYYVSLFQHKKECKSYKRCMMVKERELIQMLWLDILDRRNVLQRYRKGYNTSIINCTPCTAVGYVRTFIVQTVSLH